CNFLKSNLTNFYWAIIQYFTRDAAVHTKDVTLFLVIVVGDVGAGKTCLIGSNYNSLDHGREWLEDAMRDNDPSSVLLFLVGTKKDLSHPDQLAQMEQEAVRLAEEIRAEYWAVSALSGEGVRDFFLRVASLTFEATVLSELERNNSRQASDIVSKLFHYIKICCCH
uniref:RAB34, member RAS oncogene family b n=1 Tax=Cyprinus carpio carpio TaxID=630221 RepID=A0A9J7XJR7_CYPCA